MNQRITFGRLPNIQIDWDEFRAFDEIHCDDMRAFGIILLTIVKDDNIQLVAYDIDEQKWALLQN